MTRKENDLTIPPPTGARYFLLDAAPHWRGEP